MNADRQNWVTDPTVRQLLPTASVMTPTINSLIGSPVTVNTSSLHPLLRVLPLEREQHYSLRERSHNQLPGRTTAVNDKNFIMRMLYKYVTFND